jgi:O-antigen/teichoic acid export membrane protein
MQGSNLYRTAFAKIATRLRQKNSVYLALSLIARVMNAFGMFIAIQRFAPSTFGEMSYLQATAVSTVAFCSLGIELSINAQLTRKLQSGSPLRPTILAGCTLALAGTILACIVICTVFAPQLKLSSSPTLAVVAVCVYSSFMIATSLLTAMSFALNSSMNVGVSYIATSLIFVGFAFFAKIDVTGVGLMSFLICAQVVAVSYLAVALLRLAPRPQMQGVTAVVRRALHESAIEIKVLFVYGAKQILVVSALTFSQWFIQRKIVFGEGGTSENAIYSIGNQIFNMMTFIPLIITPIIVTRLAAAGDDVAVRRKICLGSLRLFATIAVCACVAVFFGLRLGVPFLPARYAAAVETGLIASVAAAFQIVKSPFSLFFLSELKASREIASATAGALFMIIATATIGQLHPDEGTWIRLLGCALQAVLLAVLFLIETRRRTPRQPHGGASP